MNKPGMEDEEKTLNRTGYVHIAFSTGSKEAVDRLTDRLKKDGFNVTSGQGQQVMDIMKAVL